MQDKNTKISNLKKLLLAEIQKVNSDTNLILSLSNEIASEDQNQVRFSIDAGLIDRLGKELVARQETAVSELVKNSYDADATEATLTFINSNQVGGSLKIRDDGDGMSREELINSFMRISSTDKVHNPYSKKYKRKRAGQKGIGRFAVQRLGDQLTIVTQTESSTEALKLTINWNDYKGDINLNSISNALTTIPKVRSKGTSLFINGLRERWTEAAIQRIFGYVTNILQPFPLSDLKLTEDSERITDTADPGFKASLLKETNGSIKTIENKDLTLYSYAVATIEGYLDTTGTGIYTIKSEKLGIDDINEIGNDPDDNTKPFDKIKNVRFRAFYFIYDSDLIPRQQSTIIKRYTEINGGGLRLYRNGFRVLPYGEPGNDWLKLDKSLRQRSILPSHGNNNFLGFVEIIDNDKTFVETSSREGLAENQAFIQLQNFIYRIILTGVIRIAGIRNTKITSNQKKDDDGNWEQIEFRIKNIAYSLDELDSELENESKDPEVKKKRKKRIKKLKKEISDLDKLQKSQQEKLLKEKSMLRVLSSVGLTIGQFIHEIKYYMDNIQSDIKYLSNRFLQDDSAMERLNILDDNFSTFHTYTSYFDNVVSQNVIRELRPLELRNIVRPFITSIQQDALKSRISFDEPTFNGYRLFTKPMHPSEWSSVLFNLYTNSKKAIKRANRQGRISIECGEQDSKLYLEFSDNGDGISQEIEDRIFDEFFTTTSAKDLKDITTANEILGTGLGLKIVKDIVSSYGGEIKVVSPKGEFKTCIQILINKGAYKEIESYGL